MKRTYTVTLFILFLIGVTVFYSFKKDKRVEKSLPHRQDTTQLSTSTPLVSSSQKNMPVATSTSPVTVNQKMCSSKSTDKEKSVCYLQLAKETGDLGYCWKYQANFTTCVNSVVLYRYDPNLCYHLHPDSRPGCLKAFHDNS
jgi:hypothetical protein